MTSLRITDVRPWGGPATDLHVVDGVFVATASSPDAEVVPGGGRIALPGLVDAHAHLDKTSWGTPYRPHSAGPSLASLIDNERAHRGDLGPVRERVGALLDRHIDRGVLHVRSHVDVDPQIGLDSVTGVLAAAAERAGRVTVEVVAFPQSGLLTRAGTAELMADAIDAGAQLIGGLDPAGFDGDPIRHLDTIFGIAADKHVGLDIHLHDRGTLGAWQIERIAERTEALGVRGKVTIAHCYALSTVDDVRQGALIELLAAADIALTTTVPGTTPQLPLARLAAAGVRVGLGHDGVRDLWSPYGTGDLLDKALALAVASGYRQDDDIERTARIATEGGARVLGLPDYGLEPGCRANLLLIPAESLVEAVTQRPVDRTVIAGGTVVR
ncbi:cytosine/adenosine deaminase-related metal-dependent hydrolase [Hamadaea flava]|uniref:Amidohydrolase n=1 Tax=Hamadaea flava TaxID=1742688 RepID=A0ABV8LLD3_9ACTN|nr:amidohydrolase [Hamadaea flava]MCP2329541.1 cytosine/adenosine deaminase-related metal-dependent hydrolase [Hamadaea flava]